MKIRERRRMELAQTQAGVALDDRDGPLEAAAGGRRFVIAAFSRSFSAALRVLEADNSTHTFASGA